MHTAIPTLPQEIIDEIIDRVAEADDYRRTAIAVCTLICRAWLPKSRIHLFSKALNFHPDRDRSSFEGNPIAEAHAFDVVLNKQLVDVSGCPSLRKLTLLLMEFPSNENDVPS